MQDVPGSSEVRGAYRLLRVVGSGGMGIVYEAWDTRLDRRVALKLLHPNLLADPVRREAFEREARIAARVEHPNVVRIYRCDEVDGQSAIEMQFIDGHPLSTLLRSGRLTPTQAVEVVEQVLDALACCHEHGLVHCDLKPSNLLVTPDGRVHLTDFGIARALSAPSETPSEPLSEPLWGTPRYSPPEAWQGTAPTPQWDLYATGVLFCELLTGTPLFQHSTPSVLARQVLSDPPPPLSELVPTASPELVSLLESLISRDPSRRPAKARIAQERLAGLPEYPDGADDTCPLPATGTARVTPVPASAPEESASSPPQKPTARGRWRFAAVVALLAAAGIALTAGVLSLQPRTSSGVLPRGIASALNERLTKSNGTTYYSAETPGRGQTLWCYNVTADKAESVASVVPGQVPLNPRRLIARASGEVLFAASTPEAGEELWFCSDVGGFKQVARMVKDIIPGPMGSEPEPIATHENLVYFFATTLQAGRELWCTNSLEGQTAMVVDLFPGPQGCYPGGVSAAIDENGFYIIALGDAARGEVLFRFDYASNSFREIADVAEGTSVLHEYHGRLFFTQSDPEHGAELWVHDPASNRTECLLDLWPGVQSSSPAQFYEWHDRLYFQARTEEHGTELWSSDGTLTGTALMADINPGPEPSDPYGFVEGDGDLIFRAKDAAHGQEPWVTDGTPEGTHCLADVRPGLEGSVPYNLSYHEGRLYFTANDGVHGEELWVAQRDGSEWKARLIADVMPGPANSEPHGLLWCNVNVGNLVATMPEQGKCVSLLVRSLDNYEIKPLTPLRQP